MSLLILAPLLALLVPFGAAEKEDGFSSVFHEYCVIGAGPSGLQMGYFLERSGQGEARVGRDTKCDRVIEKGPALKASLISLPLDRLPPPLFFSPQSRKRLRGF